MEPINEKYRDQIEFIQEWLGISFSLDLSDEKVCEKIVEKYYDEASDVCRWNILQTIDDIY